VEAAVVLAVASILVALAAPATSRTLENARLARAQNDTDAIAAAIHNVVTEFSPNFVPFTSTGVTGGTTVQMLVSDGDTPREVEAGASSSWTDDVGASPMVDFLERHLVTNAPIGGGSYTTAGANPWRGAYISSPIDSDPWGNRYAANVLHLRTTTTNDTFVLSVGPDEQVDSAFTVNGARPGDDDIISIVRRDPGLAVP
jgi:type II secretory pathway pseudopilin PulG